ncbi:MAG: putative RND superfamily exporter protein, partial [Candidatus Omnitrophota bacterium]
MPNRRISVGITLIAIIFGALSLIPLSQLHFEHDYKAWLSPSHPSYAIYQSFTEEYGGDNALLFHLDSDQIFFSVDSINRFLDIVKAINQDASISESTDPINYLATRHDMALITKRNFVRFKSLWDSLAKESSVMQNFLISDDSHYMGLVTYFKPDIDSGQQHSFLTHTQSALEQAGFDTHIAGPAYFGQELQNAFKKDLPMIIALLALISIICMAVIFKDFRLVIAVFICLAISLEFAMALFYLAGKQISLLSLLMIPLMYCIGLTNAIHLYHRLGSNREHDSIPFKARYYSVFVPSCLAVLTTAIGTMAFLFSDQ